MLKRIGRIKKVMNDFVMILEAKTKDTIKSGLFIREQDYDRWQGKGVVVGVGSGYRNPKGRKNRTEIRKGDLVLFNCYAQKMEINGQPYAFARYDEVYVEVL